MTSEYDQNNPQRAIYYYDSWPSYNITTWKISLISGGTYLQNHHSWHRIYNPLFHWDPLHCLAPFLQILSNLPLPPPPNLHPHCFFCCLALWLNGWSRHIWCLILRNDMINLNISSFDTLVPEGLWCVLCKKA